VASCFSYASGLGVIGQQMDLIKDSPHMSWSEWKLKDRYIPFTLEEAQASFRTTFCSKHEDGRIVLLR
jgi:hypothetical protein